MFERVDIWSPIGILFLWKCLWFLCLLKSIVWIAIETNLWVWNSFGSSVRESESLIEIWTVLERAHFGLESRGGWILLGQGL